MSHCWYQEWHLAKIALMLFLKGQSYIITYRLYAMLVFEWRNARCIIFVIFYADINLMSSIVSVRL